MSGVTVCRNEGRRSCGAAREAADLMGEAGRETILVSEDYAARLGVSAAMFGQAMKVRSLEAGGRTVAPGSPLDRPGLRRLAARIAPPTRHVPSRHPIPVWWVGDIERFEATKPEESTEETKETHGASSALADLVDDPRAPLDERERAVLRARGFSGVPEGGRDGGPPIPTRQALGEELGVSAERVRQIEERALKRLAEHAGLARS